MSGPLLQWVLLGDGKGHTPWHPGAGPAPTMVGRGEGGTQNLPERISAQSTSEGGSWKPQWRCCVSSGLGQPWNKRLPAPWEAAVGHISPAGTDLRHPQSTRLSAAFQTCGHQSLANSNLELFKEGDLGRRTSWRLCEAKGILGRRESSANPAIDDPEYLD